MTRSVSRGVRMLAALAAMLLCGWADARAAQWVTKSPCDSVTIQGVTYPRIKFSVQNLDTHAGFNMIFADPVVQPGPSDTCSIVSALAPPGWATLVDPVTMRVLWYGVTYGAFVAPGQVLDGFEAVVTREHSCCYYLVFDNAIMEPAGAANVSFACDGSTCANMPVPTLRRTWGALKSAYR